MNPTIPVFITPAERVITAFGGVRAVARAIGRNPSSVSRWRMDKQFGGTGGRVPGAVQALLLEEAKLAGVKLTAEDLIVSSRVPS